MQGNSVGTLANINPNVTTAILGLIAVLVPAIVAGIRLWLKRKHDPERINLASKAESDKIIASGDARQLNLAIDDKLRKLAASKDHSGRQGSDKD